MLRAAAKTDAALRDQALLLVGFAGAFRRSELAALAWDDVRFTGRGLEITIRRSKTDQEARGRKVAIPYGRTPSQCPVRALETWRAASQGEAGGGQNRTVFGVSPRTIARIVQRSAAATGLDPAAYGGHSLRAGLVAAAVQGGATESEIMKHTGHRSTRILRRYIREATLFDNNPVSKAGL